MSKSTAPQEGPQATAEPGTHLCPCTAHPGQSWGTPCCFLSPALGPTAVPETVSTSPIWQRRIKWCHHVAQSCILRSTSWRGAQLALDNQIHTQETENGYHKSTEHNFNGEISDLLPHLKPTLERGQRTPHQPHSLVECSAECNDNAPREDEKIARKWRV